jgi:hypothetical protein
MGPYDVFAQRTVRSNQRRVKTDSNFFMANKVYHMKKMTLGKRPDEDAPCCAGVDRLQNIQTFAHLPSQ